MAALMERVRKAWCELTGEPVKNYADLVARTAKGEEIDAESAAYILSDAGKTPADLEADADLKRRRIEAADIISKATDAAATLRRLAAEESQLTESRAADLAAIDAKYGPKFQALFDARLAANSVVHSDANARRLLAETADPTLERQIREINGKRLRLREQIEAIRQSLQEVDAAIASNVQNNDVKGLSPVSARKIQELIASQKRQRETLRDRLAEVESEHAELTADVSRLDALKLVP